MSPLAPDERTFEVIQPNQLIASLYQHEGYRVYGLFTCGEFFTPSDIEESGFVDKVDGPATLSL